MNRWRRAWLSGLILATISCTGGGGGAPDSGSAATRPTSAPTTAPAPTTDAPATTEAPTTTAAPTTAPPVLEVVIEGIAEIPGRRLSSPFRDGSTIVAASETDNGRFFGPSSFVRLDTIGNVVQEAPAGDGAIVSSIVRAGESWFAYGSFAEPDDPFVCGLRPLDPASLTMGPTLRLPTESGCGGSIVADDVNPAVVVAADVQDLVVFRVDTVTGTVTPITLDGVVPPEYQVHDLVMFQGHTYVWLRGAFDPATGTERTAADGTPLPGLIARVDGATGAATAAPVSGRFVVDGGRLVVRLGDGAAEVIDPATLTPAAIAASEIGVPDEELGLSGATAWTFGLDDAGVLTAAVRDPTTEQVVSQASVETGLGVDAFARAEAVFVGDELYVVASQQSRSAEGGTASVTKLFRAALRPAS